MDNDSLPSTLRRCFALGLGLGSGIAIGIYVARKLTQSNNSHELVVALNNVSHEIKELRTSVLVHYEKTTSTVPALTNDCSKSKVLRVDSPEVTRESKTECLELDVSSSEDDFFDFLEEGDSEGNFNKESAQESILLRTNHLIKECDNLAEKTGISDNNKEMKILEDLLARNPNNVEVLWRFGRAHKNKATFLSRREDYEEKKNIAYKGMKFVDKALELDSNHGDAHKWYAILLGITAEFEPLKEKAAIAHKYKEHITKAIELKPQDSTVYHLMGRWSFEVAMLSWWERQAATVFIGEPPTSTFEEALAHFLQAEKLNPGVFKSNVLFIGKCYQNLGDIAEAKQWLTRALDVPAKDDEDKKSHEEASTILSGM